MEKRMGFLVRTHFELLHRCPYLLKGTGTFCSIFFSFLSKGWKLEPFLHLCVKFVAAARRTLTLHSKKAVERRKQLACCKLAVASWSWEFGTKLDVLINEL